MYLINPYNITNVLRICPQATDWPLITTKLAQGQTHLEPPAAWYALQYYLMVSISVDFTAIRWERTAASWRLLSSSSITFSYSLYQETHQVKLPHQVYLKSPPFPTRLHWFMVNSHSYIHMHREQFVANIYLSISQVTLICASKGPHAGSLSITSLKHCWYTLNWKKMK